MSMYYTIYYTVLSRVCQLGLEESSDEEIKIEKVFLIKDVKRSALPKNDGKTLTRVLIFKFAINRVQVKAWLVPGQTLKPLVKATISWFLWGAMVGQKLFDEEKYDGTENLFITENNMVG